MATSARLMGVQGRVMNAVSLAYTAPAVCAFLRSQSTVAGPRTIISQGEPLWASPRGGPQAFTFTVHSGCSSSTPEVASASSFASLTRSSSNSSTFPWSSHLLHSDGAAGGPSVSIGEGAAFPQPELPPPVIISPMPCRVVVIGWMGARRKYFNKYVSLWARHGGHALLPLPTSIAETMLRWRGVVTAGRDIDRVARLHMENPGMPTFYHIFSTGGFIHAGTMWRWMDEVEDVAIRRDLLEDVGGIILDSSPAPVTEELASQALVSALTGQPASEVDMRSGLLPSAARSLMQFWLKRKSVAMRTEEVYEAWYNRAPYCPQLYLYSDADPLVPAADVERYMKIQESRGVSVSSYKWRDSGHCEHYRRYPHEYAFQVSQFVAQAIKDL